MKTANVILLVARVGTKTRKILFFDMIKCTKSRPTDFSASNVMKNSVQFMSFRFSLLAL